MGSQKTWLWLSWCAGIGLLAAASIGGTPHPLAKLSILGVAVLAISATAHIAFGASRLVEDWERSERVLADGATAILTRPVRRALALLLAAAAGVLVGWVIIVPTATAPAWQTLLAVAGVVLLTFGASFHLVYGFGDDTSRKQRAAGGARREENRLFWALLSAGILTYASGIAIGYLLAG